MINKPNIQLLSRSKSNPVDAVQFSELHPVWQELIRYCENIGFGTLEKVQIQDGLPILIEEARRKIKLG